MQSHVLLAENDELLLLAAKAGCIGVFVGIESVSADTLSEANKGFNRVDRLKNNIERFHDRGIMVDGGIICTDYTKYTGSTVIVRPKNMTVEQLQASHNRFTKDYYRMMASTGLLSSSTPWPRSPASFPMWDTG